MTICDLNKRATKVAHIMDQQGAEYGPYLLIRPLGTGTTGKVKLAVHRETQQEVAIKIISKASFQQRPNLQSKIQREVALMRLVDHPHLLKLIDVLESPRHLYIVLEYAAHGELFDFLVAHRYLKEEIALKFFRQIIYGLEYLHSLGICHRDLKPENILLDEQNNIKIADFGFARFVKTNIAETSCGSPHYAAPEVIRGQPYDGRAADVWSVGVILYALLAGYLPFDDQNIRQLLVKVKRGLYTMPKFPPPIKDLISRMLSLDPTNRITIAQIKSHEVFKYGLNAEYILPTPLPLGNFVAPIPLEEITPEIIDLLHKIGYTDDDELAIDFASEGHSMAKVFYFMLTSQISLEQLAWDSSVGGVDIFDPNNDEAFMVDPAHTSYSVLGTGDPFHRHVYPSSGQSVEIVSSLAFKAEWAIPEPTTIVYEQTHAIVCPAIPASKIMLGMQVLMRQLEMQWFHPDELTIICRHQPQNLYAIIQIQDAVEPNTPTLQLQLCIGTAEAFSVLVKAAEDIIIAIQNVPD